MLALTSKRANAIHGYTLVSMNRCTICCNAAMCPSCLVPPWLYELIRHQPHHIALLRRYLSTHGRTEWCLVAFQGPTADASSDSLIGKREQEGSSAGCILRVECGYIRTAFGNRDEPLSTLCICTLYKIIPAAVAVPAELLLGTYYLADTHGAARPGASRRSAAQLSAVER